MTISEDNRVCKLFGIKKPIIQAGMVWVSGHKLATAAANEGILGVLGAGSMTFELLQKQLSKAIKNTRGALALNVPLLYSGAERQMDLALEAGIKIFITSAGSPKKYTSKLKAAGATVAHVCSSAVLAKKCEDAGVDAVIAEGFEAGGHNGRAEITTMVLIPEVVKAVQVPVIAAGGLASGQSVLAAFCLGAEAVQIGTLFAASSESSAHQNFKEAIVAAKEDSTKLCLKKLVPVRVLKNSFYQQVEELESQGASPQELSQLLGKGRSKKGMLEGDLENGELEIGQVSAHIQKIQPLSEILLGLLKDYQICLEKIKKF